MSTYECEYETIEDDSCPALGGSTSHVNSIGARMMSEMMENLLKQSQKQRRYSQETLRLGFILNSYSSACYGYLRKVLPLPSRQTISKRYKAVQQRLERSYQQIDLDHILTCYFDRNPMQTMTEPLLCTLSIDAFSMSTLEKKYLEFHTNKVADDAYINPMDEKVEFDLEQSPDDGTCQLVTKTFNNVFLLVLNPLNWEKPPAVISAFRWTSGHANKDIVTHVFECIKRLKRYNVIVRAIASDGDSGYNCLHDAFFKVWKEIRSDDFLYVCDTIAAQKKYDLTVGEAVFRVSARPIADPLHALKIARSRVLTGTIYLADSIWVSKKSFSQFKGQRWCSDVGQLAKMNDYYALTMFSPETFLRCYEAQEWAAVIYLWPWLSLMLVIRAPFLSLKCRQSLLHGTFILFQFFFNQNLTKDFGDAKVSVRSGSGCSGRNFFEPTYLLRVIHLVLCLYLELSDTSGKLRLSCFGSHINENIIGRIRVATHGNPRFDVIMRVMAKAEMRRILQSELGIEHCIRGRDNSGGTKLDPSVPGTMEGIDFPAASKDLIKSLETNQIEWARDSLAIIVEFLSKVTERRNEIYKLYQPNQASNCGIMAEHDE